MSDWFKLSDGSAVDAYGRWNNDTGKLDIRYSQDLKASAKYIEQQRDLLDNGYDPLEKDKSWQNVGFIPQITALEWLNQGINIFDQNDWKKCIKMLNDADYKGLRISKGDI